MRDGRARYVLRVLILALLAILAFVYVAPKLSSGADADSSRARGSNNGQASESSPPSATYQSNTSFDITGVEPARDDQGNRLDRPWETSSNLPWVGTMRFTVSDPVIYESAAAAGIPIEDTDRFANYKVVVIDVTMENVDATGAKESVKTQGTSAVLLTMFDLSAPDLYCEFAGTDAPHVADLAFSGFKETTYAWAEPGSVVDFRIAYHVLGQEKVGTNADGDVYAPTDCVSPDLAYKIVFDTGWSDGAPVVELGPATLAEGAGSA